MRKERVLLLLWQALVAGASGRVARSTIGALPRCALRRAIFAAAPPPASSRRPGQRAVCKGLLPRSPLPSARSRTRPRRVKTQESRSPPASSRRPGRVRACAQCSEQRTPNSELRTANSSSARELAAALAERVCALSVPNSEQRTANSEQRLRAPSPAAGRAFHACVRACAIRNSEQRTANSEQ